MLEKLPLKPPEYWGMTPSELADMLAGSAIREQERSEREWERTAWLAMHIINISGKTVKKNVDARKLLGRTPDRKRASSKADFDELMRRQRALDAKRGSE